jgi:hypothetical protein
MFKPFKYLVLAALAAPATAALASVRRQQECNFVLVARKTSATMEPLKGVTVRSEAPLPKDKFLQLPEVMDSAGQPMPGCDATSAADSAGDATLHVKRTSLKKCASEGRDGFLYFYYRVRFVSALSACRSNATQGYPYGYPIEEHYNCFRIKKGVSSTVAATTWQTIRRICNMCPIIEGTVQPKITAAEPNGVVGEDYVVEVSFDNIDGQKKVAFDTVIDKVTLFAGGKSLEVDFTVKWLDASRVAVTFKLVKVISQPETDIIVTATHTWNLRRRRSIGAASETSQNATKTYNLLRRKFAARRAVNETYGASVNETSMRRLRSETSEHSVLVYIDNNARNNAEQTQMIILVMAIGFGSMMLLCMGVLFFAYGWVKRKVQGGRDASHQIELPGVIMSSKPAAAVIDGMLCHHTAVPVGAVMAGNA